MFSVYQCHHPQNQLSQAIPILIMDSNIIIQILNWLTSVRTNDTTWNFGHFLYGPEKNTSFFNVLNIIYYCNIKDKNKKKKKQ